MARLEQPGMGRLVPLRGNLIPGTAIFVCERD